MVSPSSGQSQVRCSRRRPTTVCQFQRVVERCSFSQICARWSCLRLLLHCTGGLVIFWKSSFQGCTVIYAAVSSYCHEKFPSGSSSAFGGSSRSPPATFFGQFTTKTLPTQTHTPPHTHPPTCLSPRRTASPASTRRPTPPAPVCKCTRTAPRSRPQRP